jgi:hypothetical protein
MTGEMSLCRVTVLPGCAPKAALTDLVLTGKAGLTWGGRYWVRTSDLFGVNQVPPIVHAGQTANPLVKSGQQRPRTARSSIQKHVYAPRAPKPEDRCHPSHRASITPPIQAE